MLPVQCKNVVCLCHERHGWVEEKEQGNRWMFGPAPERTLNIRVVFLHAWNATEIPEREIRMINTY